MRLYRYGTEYHGTTSEQLSGIISDLCALLEKLASRWDAVIDDAVDRNDSDDMVWKFARFYELSYLDRPKRYREVLRLIYDSSMDSRSYSYALAFSSNVRELFRYAGMLAEAYGKPEERIDLRKERAKLAGRLEVLRNRLRFIDDTDTEGFREFLDDTEAAVRNYRRKLDRLLRLFRRLADELSEKSCPDDIAG